MTTFKLVVQKAVLTNILVSTAASPSGRCITGWGGEGEGGGGGVPHMHACRLRPPHSTMLSAKPRPSLGCLFA